MGNTEKKSKAEILLYPLCNFGGSLGGIKKAVLNNNFTIDELEQAINLLNEGVTSALENNLAQEPVSYLNKIIAGMKLLDRLK